MSTQKNDLNSEGQNIYTGFEKMDCHNFLICEL